MDAVRGMREKICDVIAHLAYSASVPPSEAATQTGTPGIYYPIVSCTVLSSLHGRESALAGWLVTYFVDSIGEGKQLDLATTALSLLDMHEAITSKLHLFEAYFGTRFVWLGSRREAELRHVKPFPYSHRILAQYYRRSSHSFIGSRHCNRCLNNRFTACGPVMEQHLNECFPWPDTFGLQRPDLDGFNGLQGVAWSLAISICTVMMLGAAANEEYVITWGWELLFRWHASLRAALQCSEVDSETGGDISPPPYSAS